MRALFKVTGGGELGLGHVRRSMELQEKASRHGLDVLFHCNDHPTVRSLLASIPHQCDDLSKLLADLKPQVVLWDQRDTGPDELELIRDCGVSAVALDFFQHSDSTFKRVLNLYHHNREELDCATNPERLHEGHDVAIIRSQFHGQAPRFRVGESAETVLVSFGGGDPAGHTSRAIRALLEAGYGDCALIVVLGQDAEFDEEQLGTWRGDIRVLRAVDNMPELMLQADFACIGGGTTLLESCFLGLPSLVFPQTQRERDHAQSIAASGAALCASPQYEDASVKLLSLRDVALRGVMSKAGQSLVDGGGADRILRELVALATQSG